MNVGDVVNTGLNMKLIDIDWKEMKVTLKKQENIPIPKNSAKAIPINLTLGENITFIDEFSSYNKELILWDMWNNPNSNQKVMICAKIIQVERM